MYPTKRSVSNVSSLETEKKRFRSDPIDEQNIITSFEDLSNELIYEIFDYLNAEDIYRGFSRLNHRFDNVLADSTFTSLHIDFSEKSSSTICRTCEDVIIPNKHRIQSIRFQGSSVTNKFLQNCRLDASFLRLEAIFFQDIDPLQIPIILFYLKSLPRLQVLTLTIDCEDFYEVQHLDHFYRMIFSLSTLKYLKLWILHAEEEDLQLLHSDVGLQCNLEYLSLHHSFTTDQLLSVLQFTPKLRYLKVGSLNKTDEPASTTRIKLTLPSLTHLIVNFCSIPVDELETFIGGISCPLRVLRVKPVDDMGGPDTNLWRRLIKGLTPNLEKLTLMPELPYYTKFAEVSSNQTKDLLNWSFWSSRGWFCELSLSAADADLYFQSSNKTWFSDEEYREPMICSRLDLKNAGNNLMKNHSTTKVSPTVALTIENCTFLTFDEIFNDTIAKHCSSIAFTHLNLNYHDLSAEVFKRVMKCFPNLKSLKIFSLSITEDDSIPPKDPVVFPITKLKLGPKFLSHQASYLFKLCPALQYLEVECTIEHQYLARMISLVALDNLDYVPHLNIVCFSISDRSDRIFREIDKIIDYERLFYGAKCFRDYIVYRQLDKIFLQWKLSS